MIFLPADVVMSAMSPSAKDRSIAYEIAYDKSGVYPDGFDFKRLVKTNLCEKVYVKFLHVFGVFKGTCFLRDLLASGVTDCSFDTSSTQLSANCKILHYACEDDQWINSSQHEDVVGDRELLATIKKRCSARLI